MRSYIYLNVEATTGKSEVRRLHKLNISKMEYLCNYRFTLDTYGESKPKN
jgi:hypothetical protein